MQATLDVTRAVSHRLEIRCNKTRLYIASVGCSVPMPKIAKSTKIERVQRDMHCTNYRERVQKAAQDQPSIPSLKRDVNIMCRRIV